MESSTTGAPSDQALVTQALQDPEAFGALMERYEKPLSRYLMRLTGWGTDEMSDILQEAFIKAYRHLNDYDEELKFSTWMYRITHNQAIDTLRSHRARSIVTQAPLEDVAQFVPDSLDIEAEFLREEDMTRVQAAILALPLLYRDVLVLRFLEERSYEEIVDILKKPKGTIATLIRRGRTFLLAALEQKP